MEGVVMKRCSVCEKDIEEPKFRLHESACARMNYKCAKCGDVLAKADRETHEHDNHTKVRPQFHPY